MKIFSMNSIAFLIQFLFIIQLFAMGSMEMSNPFWPIHLQSFTPQNLLSFASTAVYIFPMIGIMLTSSFWGKLSDRTGKKAMMIRALLGLSLTQFIVAFVSDLWLVILLRFLQGVFAGYVAPAQAYGVAMLPAAKRTRFFALLQVSTNAGSLIGAIIGGLIIDLLSFFWINITASIICGICILAVFFILPNDKHKLPISMEITEAKEHNDLQKNNRYILVGLLILLGFVLMSRMLTQAPFSLYIDNIFNTPHWVTGLAYGLQATGVIVSASLWARWFESLTLVDSLRRMLIIIAGCIVLTWILGLVRRIDLFIALYFLWGVLLGATTPIITSLISKSYSYNKQGYVLGLAQSVSQFASIIGIGLGGFIFEFPGLPYLFFCIAMMYLITFIVTLLVTTSLKKYCY